MAGPSDLHDVCREFLALCEAAVATTYGGAIDRAFVSPGVPALDCCPQLTVHAGGPQEADAAPLSPPLVTGQRASGDIGSLQLVDVTATVVRCVPIIEGNRLPTPAEMQDAARKTNEDVWAIWNWIRRKKADGTLFPSPSGKREVLISPAFPVDTSGGCGGWQIGLKVALGGYEL